MNRKNSSAVTVEEGAVALPAKPFLKWAGGKRQSLPQLLANMPRSFKTYYEPMLGAGALFFGLYDQTLEPRKAVLADINHDLVNTYEVVRSKLDKLIPLLKQHAAKHSRTYYYRLRMADRDSAFWTWSDVERAARFIYLNKTCYNGLYRVNSRDEFNVPFGDYKQPSILDEETLRNCSHALQQTTLLRGSFEQVVEDAKRGDFVYFDPPYEPLNQTSNFTQYAHGGFSSTDQTRLAETYRELNRRGVHVMLSNSSAPLIHKLYHGFEIVEVSVARAINSKAERRGKVTELLVKNY